MLVGGSDDRLIVRMGACSQIGELTFGAEARIPAVRNRNAILRIWESGLTIDVENLGVDFEVPWSELSYAGLRIGPGTFWFWEFEQRGDDSVQCAVVATVGPDSLGTDEGPRAPKALHHISQRIEVEYFPSSLGGEPFEVRRLHAGVESGPEYLARPRATYLADRIIEPS